MAFDMTYGPPQTGETPEVATHLVVDDVTLDEAEVVSTQVCGGEPSSGDRRAVQLSRLDDPWGEAGFRVVARIAGRPTATGGCQVVGEVARLYGACCLPNARGRGGYRAVLRAPLELARSRGATLALVHARVDTSQPILVRLGFEVYGRGHLYRLPVGEPAAGAG